MNVEMTRGGLALYACQHVRRMHPGHVKRCVKMRERRPLTQVQWRIQSRIESALTGTKRDELPDGCNSQSREVLEAVYWVMHTI